MKKDSTRGQVSTTKGIMNEILKNISFLALLLLTPFAIINFLNGRIGLGFGNLTLIGIFAGNIWALKNDKPNLLEHLILFGLIPIGVMYLSFSIHIQKIIGVLWCYPTIVACYYFLPEIKARIANILFVVFTFPVIWNTFDVDIVTRIYVTIILVSFSAAVFIKLINQQQDILRETATTDFLTGVLNRTLLQRHLEEAIDQYQRTDLPMTLVVLDLDNFKNVNDNFGHVKGDEVLKDVAKLLQLRCRKVDKIFRLGGEEFLVLLYNTALHNAINICEELRISISNLNTISDHSVTVSLGATTIKDKESYLSWIKRTDDKLYLAKKNGRNKLEY